MRAYICNLHSGLNNGGVIFVQFKACILTMDVRAAENPAHPLKMNFTVNLCPHWTYLNPPYYNICNIASVQ